MTAAPGNRVTLVVPSLRSGGAERAVAIIAGFWAGRGREVTLITTEPVSTDFYPLDPRVRRVALGLPTPAASAAKWTVVRHVRRVVRGLRRELAASRPDVVISFMEFTNILTLLAARGLRIPVVVMEQIDPRMFDIHPVWNWLRRVLYPRARAIVVQTESVRGWADASFPRSPVEVVPNPLLPPAASESDARPARLPSGRVVAAMGRLVPQKGFDLLLPAFARCAAHHPEWSLVILGEGSDRADLERLAAELGVAERVHMPGTLSDPFAVLRHADMFVLSSRYEGLPYALLEAMAVGLPVVSTDCPSGPSEVISDGVDALLVPPEDVGALAAAMDRLMGDAAERARLAARSPDVLVRFGIERVMDRWEAVVHRVLAAAREE